MAFSTLPDTDNFAQSDPWIGSWQLNLAKSTYDPGPPPRSQSAKVEGTGENRKETLAGVDAAGNAFTQVYVFIHDGQPHPVTGVPAWDSVIYTPVDNYTVNWTLTKVGKPVRVGTDTVSPDGTTFSIMSTGVDADGRPFKIIAVFERH